MKRHHAKKAAVKADNIGMIRLKSHTSLLEFGWVPSIVIIADIAKIAKISKRILYN